MAMTDPSEWAGDLSAESDPWLQDFVLISQKMVKVYGDKNRRYVGVITLMHGYIQLPQESVRAYANRLKANWRQAGWNLQKHKEVLYDIAWAGLRNCLMNTVGPMRPACGRLESLDEFFDKAAASEVTPVDHKKPQQQQQQQKNHAKNSSSKDSKRGYRPPISKLANTSSGGKSGLLGSTRHGKSGRGSQSSGLPPAAWNWTEIFEGRLSP
jgi:hypothetical protein